jgi:predicted nucleic acid-binding protein
MGSRTAKATMIASGNILVVDADAFIAYVDEDDAHAEKTITILQACVEREMILLYPATVIVEAVTTLQRRLRKPFLAQKIVDEVQAQQFIIEPVTQEIIEAAASLFRTEGSKHHTLFDAVVAAMARKLNARAVFSFDAWYKSQDLSLARDIF